MAVPKSIIGKIISIMWTSLICEGSGMQLLEATQKAAASQSKCNHM